MRNATFGIHSQHIDCRATCRRKPCESPVLAPSEVIIPFLLARMKEFGHAPCLWVKPGKIWSLEAITHNASQTEIVCRVVATVFDWNDVVNLEAG